MKNRILLAGMPSSGKTTYIAGLWYFVSQNMDNKSLILDSLTGSNDQYLNNIRQKWVEYKKVPRTSRGSESGEPVRMNLIRSTDQKKLVLNIPDFSGEIFNEQFEFREWSQEFNNEINTTDGVILFIDPNDSNNKPHLLFHSNEITSAMGEHDFNVTEMSINEWKHEYTPIQTKLVDFLQFLDYKRKLPAGFKIAIIVSSWDEIIKAYDAITPLNWIENNLPLFHQYIVCNKHLFSIEYFGVSAQGGDYENPNSLEDLLSKDPLERIIVQQGEEISNDIAKPILWITTDDN